MDAGAEGTTTRGEEDSSHAISAGRVGRAHGLDGSFYVTGARPRLLALGSAVTLAGWTDTITRRAGTDEHPIVRLRQIKDRPSVEALRGSELTVEVARAPALEDGEWWAHELEGCEVIDGERHIGTVVGLLELPSCEALEVRLASAPGFSGAPSVEAGSCEPVGSLARAEQGPRRASGGELLVPLVRDAIRQIDPVERRIDVNMDFLGDT